MTEDLTSVDFFRDSRLTDDPFPFYEALRNKCPVTREDHYGVTMGDDGISQVVSRRLPRDERTAATA